MSIEKLKRVMWRLRKIIHDRQLETRDKSIRATNMELRRAIMLEIGTDWKTGSRNRRALINLRWIKSHGKNRVQLTDRDLTDT